MSFFNKLYLFFVKGWDRLHGGSDQGCPRKSESWDVLHEPSSNDYHTNDYQGYDVGNDAGVDHQGNGENHGGGSDHLG